jgi:hypothetical protein
MGFGLPILIQDQSLTMGTVVKFLYNVPTNSSVYLDPMFNRERRAVPKTSRWDIYSMLEAACDRYTQADTKRKTKSDSQGISAALIYGLHGLICGISITKYSLDHVRIARSNNDSK